MVNLMRKDKESALPSNRDTFLAQEALRRLAEHFQSSGAPSHSFS